MTTGLGGTHEPETRTTVAISGSSGLIGSALVSALGARAHAFAHAFAVKRLARGQADPAALDGVDVVVNLAGEPLDQRWSREVKRQIHDSRVETTSRLARAIAGLAKKPRVMISGSAIGIYGNRGDEPLDESSSLGGDFLASVCKDWEAATAPARDAGIRVVNMRTGIVLAKQGGALAKMLLPFRLGVGGRLGSGRQWMSWIALADMVGAIELAMRAESMAGAVNFVAPNPVTNADFTRALANELHRPSLFPVPRVALELLFGEMADQAVLASQRVSPRRLLGAGFTFRLPALEQALASILS